MTGSVGASATDVSLGIESSAGSEVSSGSEITYTITYGSTSPISFPVTLVAQWEKGSIEGAIGPTVELLTYTEGSATTAYGGTVPVIDVVNRKITWTIPSFPAQTVDQTVQFVLTTTSEYRGSKNVTARVTAMVTTPSGVPDKTVVTTYKYQEPAQTSTPTPTPSSTTAPLVSSPSFEQIELVELSDTRATFRITSNSELQVTAKLGTNTASMAERVTTAARSKLQPLTLVELSPDTTYFVQFTGINGAGSRVTSSIYTFKTSSKANPDLIVDRNSIVVSQSWGILFNQSMLQKPTDLPHFSVSQNTMLDFLFRIPLSRDLKEATLLLRDPYVLGISSDPESDYSSSTTRLVEVNPGTFVGKIKTPLLSRTYEIAIRTEDIYGNLYEQTVGQTTVVQPFRVVDTASKPLWGAEVLLWSYQDKTRQFELAPFNALSFQNPIITNKNGTADFSLIPGRYKARVSMTGFETKEVEFDITAPQSEDLPVVSLRPVRFGILGRFMTGIELGRQNLKLTIGALPQANPTGSLYDVLLPFNLVFLFLLIIAIVFQLRILRFPLRTLLSHLKSKNSQMFSVVLEDASTSSRVSNAMIYLVDEQKHLIVARAKTGLDGSVQFPLALVPAISSFFIKRHGYILPSHPTYNKAEIQGNATIPVTVEQLPATTVLTLLAQELRSMSSEFIGFGSEAFLTLSLLCTLLFTMTLTPTRTIVFASLTLLNVALWLIIARHSYGLRIQKNV